MLSAVRRMTARDFIVAALHTVIVAALFRVAVVNEGNLDGDLEWVFFYGAHLVISCLSGMLLISEKASVAVISLACLVPLASPGMFLIVGMIFGLIVSSIGVFVGGGIRRGVMKLRSSKAE